MKSSTFELGLSFIKKSGIAIKKFVSDRHTGIAKWIRETHDTLHFFDIWHVARSVTKKMLKAAKVRNCECIKDWVKAVRNHLYWCATSTKEGFGEMIHAKWMSFLRHVRNVHDKHPSEVFTKCAHEESIKPRKWMKNGKVNLFNQSISTLILFTTACFALGTIAYEKVTSIFGNKSLQAAIKKLSSDAQTSCLEGFHATLNFWYPKMLFFMDGIM